MGSIYASSYKGGSGANIVKVGFTDRPVELMVLELNMQSIKALPIWANPKAMLENVLVEEVDSFLSMRVEERRSSDDGPQGEVKA